MIAFTNAYGKQDASFSKKGKIYCSERDKILTTISDFHLELRAMYLGKEKELFSV